MSPTAGMRTALAADHLSLPRRPPGKVATAVRPRRGCRRCPHGDPHRQSKDYRIHHPGALPGVRRDERRRVPRHRPPADASGDASVVSRAVEQLAKLAMRVRFPSPASCITAAQGICQIRRSPFRSWPTCRRPIPSSRRLGDLLLRRAGARWRRWCGRWLDRWPAWSPPGSAAHGPRSPGPPWCWPLRSRSPSRRRCSTRPTSSRPW